MSFKIKGFLSVVVLLMAGLFVTGCSSPSSSLPSTKAVRLNGAGATFPYPLYSRWFDEYAKLYNVEVNFQSIGSGGGIKQITEGTVDFGASDGIMTPEEQAAAEKAGGPILHIPMTMGAVAIVYNLPGVNALKLSPDVLADIYLGKITKANDQRLAALNSGVSLPPTDFVTVHRSDGSGTTYIFTNYLSKISKEWSDRVGNAKSVAWPEGVGGQGNEGVAGQVRQMPGAIGYVELAYANQNKMATVLLQNAAGKFMAPTLEATSAAATGVALPDDMKVMITNSPNQDAYPIAGFTWLLVYRQQKDQVKGKALVDMLWWAIHDGQKDGPPLDYAGLPTDAVHKAENEIRSITYNGQPLLQK
ncbi:MAG: phosphate ABC transporter substrate-binding protein PstS [Dehalococcoidales bacterium]|nr:phosphate ABC transporter substrate-binding protein PstS [Dehalococcoidales bacterium]